ncbi:MAG TPA: ParB/RepB/Spo0J family partition protein [Spirochaetia bacterium]|nr:ParB/RepB/Spo0J family partition protein [Spirochaetia bacterium]
MSKKALGKGIGALLNTTKPEAGLQASLSVEIDRIRTNPDQPRKHFSEAGLNELAASIKEKGVIQPILVEQNPDQSYTLIAGERRFRAAKLAGLAVIPVLIRSFNEIEKLEIALVENIQREDLTPIEEAAAYDSLLKLSGVNQDELAAHLGKNRSTIANSLRLLKLPEEMKAALDQREISAGHARAILSVNGKDAQASLFHAIHEKGLSVREAEALAQKMNTGGGKKGKKPGSGTLSLPGRIPELEELKQKLIEKLGTKVEFKGTLSEGKIEISYFSPDDLERIYEILFP